MVRRTIDDLYPSMPWDALDAVVFDVGNVLIAFDPQKILEEYVPDTSLHPILMERIFQAPYWEMQDRGILYREEAIEVMTGPHRELEPAIRRVMENWIDLRESIPEGVAALEAVKAHGKPAYILSNYNDAAFWHMTKLHPFFRRIDGFVISAEVKMCKPDPQIYRHLLNTFHLNAERTLFIDDSPVNIEAALNEGLQGFCFNRPGKLRDFLQAKNA